MIEANDLTILGELTTVLPTVPGIYLFCGSHSRGGIASALENLRYHTELIRIGYSGNNQLMYIGRDMYRPKEMVGYWLRFDNVVSGLEERTTKLLIEAFVVGDLVEWFRSAGWGTPLHMTETRFTQWLVERLGRNSGLPQRVLDAALASNTIKRTEGGYVQLEMKP